MNQALPLIVGIGGTATPESSTETALMLALAAAEREGVRTKLFGSQTLAELPHYLTSASRTSPHAQELLEYVRKADGFIIASPGYHGSISGIVKNAIDYLEETAKDQRVYMDGLPVGLIATAYGWQAATSTLATLRSIVHALRGWPTPLGVAVNCSGGILKAGKCSDPRALAQLDLVGQQVCQFARLRQSNPRIMETTSEVPQLTNKAP
jgi:FMN reductase